MIHNEWPERKTQKRVICIHTDAKKYKVNEKLTKGTIYDVKHETDEFYFIIDNSHRIGGFYKEYFKDVS